MSLMQRVSGEGNRRSEQKRQVLLCEHEQVLRRCHIVCMTDVPLPIDENSSFIPSNII